LNPSDLKIVFMGTPDFAASSLDGLVELGCEISAVVSQPDRPKGRGRTLQRTAVASCADRHGIPVHQWPRLNNESYGILRDLAPDLIVVVAYGKILPRRYLELPRFGCFNVHASVLPNLRGAAPIQWAVIRGHAETGVSIMRLDEGMDTGDVCHTVKTPIGPDETAGDLHDRLAVLGAEALGQAIGSLCAGSIEFEAQNHEAATVAPRLAKADGLIDWTSSAQEIHDRVRGVSPWPGAFVEQVDGPLKIHQTRVIILDAGSEEAEPGSVSSHGVDGPIVACGSPSQAIVLCRLQRPGRRAVSGAEFIRGKHLPLGTRLGVQ
jgi:methionyl-tRNA formyltransferase